MSDVLKIDDLRSGYGQLPVLDGVSLNVGQGEIVSVLGANGAGKTTLLLTISGHLPAFSGHVQFEGESFDRIPAHEAAARGLVMVPEGGRLFPFMTVLENLELGAYHPAARACMAQSLDEVMGLFPIMAERRGQLAGGLSGGERQMCALARAQCAADVLRLRLQGLPTHACQIDLVGVDSVLRGSARAAAAPPAELRVHISAACDDAATAQWVEDEVYALTLSGPAGGCSVRSEKRPRLAVVDGLIDRRLVTTELVWGQP